MKKKIIFCLIIFFCLFALADFGLAKKCATDDDCQIVAKPEYRTIKCINERCVRALEITYPKIAGEELTVKRIVEEGLPGYVEYIFTVAVGLIGFIIFGVLIYNGIRYLISVGRPEQMADARSGILYAFLGALLLLSSVLIFRTINPQLTIMELPKIDPLEQVVAPGVYVCNYKADKAKLKEALKGYINGKDEEQIKAAKKLREIIWGPETGQSCWKVNFSGNFPGFEVEKDDTIFIVPSISEDPDTGKRTPKYKYGIVLHQKDNFGGQCDYFPKKGGTLVYDQIEGFSAKGLGFTARSVILFQKPLVEPVRDGVTLYQYFNYNRDAPRGVIAAQKSFKPEGGANLKKVRAADLGNLRKNTRSITFSPAGSYFALVYEGENFDKRCKFLRRNNPNIMDIPVGLCGKGCEHFLSRWAYGAASLVGLARGKIERCAPCLNSMIVIKGIVL